MSMQNAMKAFEEKFKEECQLIMFPDEDIDPRLYHFAELALRSLSVMDVKCDADVYQKLVANLQPENIPSWDLFTIAYAINAPETSSPQAMGLTVVEYAEVIGWTRKMAQRWNDLVAPIKEKLMNIKPEPAQPGKGKVLKLGTHKRSVKPPRNGR